MDAFFQGAPPRPRGVSQRGASAKGESSAAILARAKAERLAREQHRHEVQAAERICRAGRHRLLRLQIREHVGELLQRDLNDDKIFSDDTKQTQVQRLAHMLRLFAYYTLESTVIQLRPSHPILPKADRTSTKGLPFVSSAVACREVELTEKTLTVVHKATRSGLLPSMYQADPGAARSVGALVRACSCLQLHGGLKGRSGAEKRDAQRSGLSDDDVIGMALQLCNEDVWRSCRAASTVSIAAGHCGLYTTLRHSLLEKSYSTDAERDRFLLQCFAIALQAYRTDDGHDKPLMQECSFSFAMELLTLPNVLKLLPKPVRELMLQARLGAYVMSTLATLWSKEADTQARRRPSAAGRPQPLALEHQLDAGMATALVDNLLLLCRPLLSVPQKVTSTKAPARQASSVLDNMVTVLNAIVQTFPAVLESEEADEDKELDSDDDGATALEKKAGGELDSVGRGHELALGNGEMDASPALLRHLFVAPSSDRIATRLVGLLADSEVVAYRVSADALPPMCSLLLRLLQLRAGDRRRLLSQMAFGNSKIRSAAGLGSQASDEFGMVDRLWLACSPGEHMLRVDASSSGKNSGAQVASNGDVYIRTDSSPVAAVWALGDGIAPVFVLFTVLYEHLLSVQGDDEFFRYQAPFTRERMCTIAEATRVIYLRYVISVSEAASGGGGAATATKDAIAHQRVFGGERNVAREAVTSVLIRLHTRNARASERQRFMDPDFWALKAIETHDAEILDELAASPLETTSAMAKPRGSSKKVAFLATTRMLLRSCPILVPFRTRVDLFHRTLDNERLSGNKWVQIRRDHIYEDAYAKLNHLQRNLRGRVRVAFIDVHGIPEAGVDGNGVFKEFMHQLMSEVFSPSYGLMNATTDGMLYPNPASNITVGENHLEQMAFLGRMLGKALFETLLIDLPLADAFVAKLLERRNDVNDLRSIDPELYRNLMSLKALSDLELRALELNFTIANSEYDDKEVELIQNGANVNVTKSNLVSYIYRVADFRLNVQMKQNTQAFLRGLSDVISISLLQIFEPSELQLLISGTDARVDTQDLRQHTSYYGYSDDSPVIQWFWEIFTEMEPAEQQKVLYFSTSSIRAPLLGFKFLYPSFAIHRAASEDRLPTASTCLNLLKLPDCRSKEVLQEKLHYAINSQAGFDLS